mmetsp:Transcript_52773/g.60408  ORF Transcript_52773/g.60408 Transcript_52773/m.60408 type:complete len:502 (+) Transcript_52773:48-1553(+)
MMKAMSMGAGNAYSFSASLSHGHKPKKTSISYQGIFNEHCYQLKERENEHVVNVEIETAQSVDQESAPTFWVSLLFKSKLDGAPRDERPIDLVVVLDQSGSMDSKVENKTKMELAKIGIEKLYKILRPNDRLGLCRFNNDANVVFDIQQVEDIAPTTFQTAIDSVVVDGGTTLSAGFACGLSMFDEWTKGQSVEDPLADIREKRIIFLTDMEGMGGDTLSQLLKKGVGKNIFTSVVGLGLDFNSSLTESIIKVPGANYFTTRDEKDLEEILVKDFFYNFFPASHGNTLTFSSEDFELVNTYGTPLDPESEKMELDWLPKHHRQYPKDFKDRAMTFLLSLRRSSMKVPMIAFSEIMDFIAPREVEVSRLETIFPSAMPDDNNIEGGLILLKLKPKRKEITQGTAGLGLRWRHLDGSEGKLSHSVTLNTNTTAIIGDNSTNIDKGYALTRYVETVHSMLDNSEKNKANALLVKEWFEEQASKYPKDEKFDTRRKDFQKVLEIK